MRLSWVIRVASVTVAFAAAVAVACPAEAAPFVLSVGVGDGSLSVGVDGYGSFGSAIGVNSSNAVFDPVGAVGSAGTTFDSGVAVRLGPAGARTFLTSGSIGGSGGLTNPTVTGTATSATSTFSFLGLNFVLTQTLTPLFSGGTQIGAQLDQVYTIINPSTASPASLELVRYLDGDLLFDGSLVDGGGRLTSPVETLFETDSATGAPDPTTFVGIRAAGGTIPLTGRFEIDSFAGLRSRIIAGTALDNTITGDGNLDGFINNGSGYDVTLALNNLLLIGAGQSATYTTTTIFGSGAPTDVPGDTTVPEPGTLILMGSGMAWLARRARRTR